MTSTQNRLRADKPGPNTPPNLRLDPATISTKGTAQAILAQVIAEETEKKRESQRGKHGMVPRGLLGNLFDYVDTQHWDEYLQDIDVLAACAERAGVARTQVLDFAIEECSPPNWRALFWMRAWYEQIYRNTAADMAEATKDLEKLYARKQVESARQRAKEMADARHGKPGGNRDKQATIRAIWASGKYSSRDVCAEQECAGLAMSISTARKALRNTPNPA